MKAEHRVLKLNMGVFYLTFRGRIYVTLPGLDGHHPCPALHARNVSDHPNQMLMILHIIEGNDN